MDVTWTLARSSPFQNPLGFVSVVRTKGWEKYYFELEGEKGRHYRSWKFLPSCCRVLQHRETGAHLLPANPKQGAAKPEPALPSWLGPEAALAGLALDQAHTDAVWDADPVTPGSEHRWANATWGWAGEEYAISYFKNISVLFFGMWKGK